MPLYEYLCAKCGHRFERIRKFSDPPLTRCPECGGKIEQLLSAPAVQFKGSGWYVTDYARKGAGGSSSEPSATPDPPKSDPGAASKSDSPAPPSEPKKHDRKKKS